MGIVRRSLNISPISAVALSRLHQLLKSIFPIFSGQHLVISNDACSVSSACRISPSDLDWYRRYAAGSINAARSSLWMLESGGDVSFTYEPNSNPFIHLSSSGTDARIDSKFMSLVDSAVLAFGFM